MYRRAHVVGCVRCACHGRRGGRRGCAALSAVRPRNVRAWEVRVQWIANQHARRCRACLRALTKPAVPDASIFGTSVEGRRVRELGDRRDSAKGSERLRTRGASVTEAATLLSAGSCYLLEIMFHSSPHAIAASTGTCRN